jgi:uncharacterized protein YndB with AHSA1/START domain
MTHASENTQTHAASRFIAAPRRVIYQAYLEPEALASWRPPQGMRAEIHEFDPREGGAFRMSFAYRDTKHAVAGKTSEHADTFHGQFVELVPDRRIVERVEFESNDPAFAGAMTITTTLTAKANGTDITILCENVPRGIRAEDHEIGMTSTLANLAAFTEHHPAVTGRSP